MHTPNTDARGPSTSLWLYGHGVLRRAGRGAGSVGIAPLTGRPRGGVPRYRGDRFFRDGRDRCRIGARGGIWAVDRRRFRSHDRRRRRPGAADRRRRRDCRGAGAGAATARLWVDSAEASVAAEYCRPGSVDKAFVWHSCPAQSRRQRPNEKRQISEEKKCENAHSADASVFRRPCKRTYLPRLLRLKRIGITWDYSFIAIDARTKSRHGTPS